MLGQRTVDPTVETLPEECSLLYLAIEHELAAVVCIEDPLRKEAADVVRALKATGLEKVVMMTGDSERTAAAIAKRVGVDEYYSEVLPEDKASFVEREKALGRKVIMVGDGINDSPRSQRPTQEWPSVTAPSWPERLRISPSPGITCINWLF